MYKKEILKNGIRLITVPMPATQTFTILVMVAAGSRHENKSNNGISHFLEHMIFKGTPKRPDTLAISSELDGIGGEFNAFTSKEYTGYYVKVDGRQASRAISVLGDILINSKFDGREIERERGVIIEEINMYDNNPMIKIDDLFEECLYGDTPSGWDTIGTKENIQKISRAEIVKYWRGHYQGRNIIAGAAGSYQARDLALVKKLFAEIIAGKKNEADNNSEAQTSPRVKIKKQKTAQVNLSLGARACGYHHQDYDAVKLLGVVLGGSMSSRMFISVRERQGLAYQIHTQTEGYKDSGYLTTTMGTSADKVERAVAAVLSEYKKISRQDVPDQELKKAKDYICGKTTLYLESSDNMASWFLRQEALDRKVATPAEHFAKIEKITAADIKRVAGDIFKNHNLNLAGIGYDLNEKKLKKALKL